MGNSIHIKEELLTSVVGLQADFSPLVLGGFWSVSLRLQVLVLRMNDRARKAPAAMMLIPRRVVLQGCVAVQEG
jgi:hypothetical protein